MISSGYGIDNLTPVRFKETNSLTKRAALYSKLYGIVIIALTGCSTSLAQSTSLLDNAKPYNVPDSQIHDLPTSGNGIHYQLYVHVPPPCQLAGSSCPTVYLLDAEYSFALAAQIVTHLADRNRMPPVISIAIAYPDKSRYRRFRTRDYTPYYFATGGYGEDIQKESGGGPAFLEVIKKEIIPYVEVTFHVSRENRTLVGHSYGGLFATHAWISSPDTFRNYIIISPSLWYADGRVYSDIAKACAESPDRNQRNLFLAVGEYEEQPDNGRAMVSDLQRMDDALSHCSKREVATYFRVFSDESHASIFPAALSTGLRKHFQ